MPDIKVELSDVLTKSNTGVIFVANFMMFDGEYHIVCKKKSINVFHTFRGGAADRNSEP